MSGRSDGARGVQTPRLSRTSQSPKPKAKIGEIKLGEVRPPVAENLPACRIRSHQCDPPKEEGAPVLARPPPHGESQIREWGHSPCAHPSAYALPAWPSSWHKLNARQVSLSCIGARETRMDVSVTRIAGCPRAWTLKDLLGRPIGRIIEDRS